MCWSCLPTRRALFVITSWKCEFRMWCEWECILIEQCKQKTKESSRCVVEIMALSFRPYFEGGIERLVKNNILPPLELSDLEQCRDCIKEKYVKKIKKDAKTKRRNSTDYSHRHLWSVSWKECGWKWFVHNIHKWLLPLWLHLSNQRMAYPKRMT